jgi:hypothetical protein
MLRELLSRRQARRTLQAFTEFTSERWAASRLHTAICEQFDRVESGEIDRLMLLLPPQHGKSHIASRRYPAYSLGHDPRHDIISASATGTLAEEFGRDVRNLIAGPEYRALFSTTLAEDSQAAGRWKTHEEGSYYAVGIGGALMGRGATRLIIDDPFATMQDAQSENARDRVWDWYVGTAYNRVRPKGAIVLIQHRMHEDDLAGRLIERQKAGGDKWEIVLLPAIADGRALWPERYDLPALERIRANTAPLHWSALYQQNPMPDEGTFFKTDWLAFVAAAPANVHKYTTGDFAVTEDGGDWTDIGTHGYAPEGTLYLALDGWCGQTAPDAWIDALIDQFAKHKPYAFFGESGVIKRSLEGFIRRRMIERKTHCRLEWLPSSADKPAMARSLQGMASLGKVKIIDSEYGHRLKRAMLNFPAGKVDDPVDMASLMGRAIDQAHPAVLKATHPELQPRDSYSRLFDRSESNEWKTA